jgi:alpha-N-acetylglucosaminidase
MMQKPKHRVSFLATLAILAAATPVFAAGQESAARGVLERLLHQKSDAFVLKEIPKEDGRDVFEIEAQGGKVYISGSSGVAMCRGAYEYLKKACNSMVSWEGSQVDLPDRLPDYPKTRTVCPYRYRHYFNVCTFGYTMVWWDWKRWEREIDWMALHGINMPLAMNGQEAIWRRVWHSYGLTDKDLEAFFSGPAFLPWHRMGNLNGHAGPLPVSWMEAQAELQKKILARERSLGIIPVTPGFSGFVPPALARLYPKAAVRKGSGWNGFEPTLTLDPKDPMFTEIGSKFVREYQKEFGTDHLWLCDTFNEMTPQIDEATKLDYLADIGEAVYKSIIAGDPDGTWVMMGWLFMDGGFWTEPAKKALFSRVPVDRMILLDLGTDVYAISYDSPEFRKRQWVYCFLTNFGGNTTMCGVPSYYTASPVKALERPDRGQLIGIGTTPEGLEQNPMNYEVICDQMWQPTPIRLKTWIVDYCRERYSSCPKEIGEAWDLMLGTVYNVNFARLPAYGMRPALGMRPNSGPYDQTKVRKAIELFLSAADKLGSNGLYRRDLVDLVKQYISDGLAYHPQRVLDAYLDKDRTALAKASSEYLDGVRDIDRLIATRREYRLSNWINAARAWGKTDAEKRLYEQNARMQLTVWGGPDLHDYAYKDWTGLITDFHIPRARLFLDKLASSDPDKPFDPKWKEIIADWELGWCKSTTPIKELAGGDSVAIARKLFANYRDWPEKWVPKPADPGIAVRKPVTVSGGTTGDHTPDRAVDGNSDDWDFSSWWAGSPPQWLQIDLGKPTKIDRVQVWTYWDWMRCYQYKVEISPDAESWTMVADMSKNTLPSTSRGFLHKFAPTEARYVRVTCFGNSADRGIHLVEVRVFEGK